MDFSPIRPDFTTLYFVPIFAVYCLISLYALIELFTKRFKDKNDKIFWLVAILFLGGFAAVFYFIKREDLIDRSSSEQSLSPGSDS
jgi:uncharacterized membrane protein YhaH (DUF805 family)